MGQDCELFLPFWRYLGSIPILPGQSISTCETKHNYFLGLQTDKRNRLLNPAVHMHAAR